MPRTTPTLSRPLIRKIARPLLHANTLTTTGSPLVTKKPRANYQERASRAHWLSAQISTPYRKAIFCPSFATRLHSQFPEWDLKKTTPPNNHAVAIWMGMTPEQKLIWQTIKDEAHRQPDFLLPQKTLLAKSKASISD